MRVIIGFAVVLMIAGCSGQTRIHSYPDHGALQQDLASEDGVEGVIVYPPAWHREIYATSVRVDDKGQILGRADGQGGPECTPVVTSTLALHPDLARPMRINYEPGHFETNSFGVTLDRGMLAAVNTQSTPERGATLAGVGTAAAALITALAFAEDEEAERPACNQGKVLIAVERCERSDCRERDPF